MAAEHQSESLLKSWVKNPASWIAVLSLLISSLTSYTVNLRKGTLEISLPSQIGFLPDQNGALSLLVPTAFHHTGAPNRQQIVRAIDATVLIAPDAGVVSQPMKYHWRSTHRFVGKYEFELKYPNRKQEGVEDYIDYEGRSGLFGLSGGDVMIKVLGLKPPSRTEECRAPAFIELSLEVLTEDANVYVSKARYRLLEADLEAARKQGIYIWISSANKTT